jgi:hypothetical protein
VEVKITEGVRGDRQKERELACVRVSERGE